MAESLAKAEAAEQATRVQEEKATEERRLREAAETRAADAEATNASLSAQLVQLTQGAAAHAARLREDQLSQTLSRRFALQQDVVRENLEAVQARLRDRVSLDWFTPTP